MVAACPLAVAVEGKEGGNGEETRGAPGAQRSVTDSPNINRKSCRGWDGKGAFERRRIVEGQSSQEQNGRATSVKQEAEGALFQQPGHRALGRIGSARHGMEHIDRLAEEAVRVLRFDVESSCCM